MNRIIVIGNGFDLAHGLPTSYRNFLDDYWERTIKDINKTSSGNDFENKEVKLKISLFFKKLVTYNDLQEFLTKKSVSNFFKNRFLEIITQKNYKNWVDIENEYYQLLLNNSLPDSKPATKYEIDNLNRDFNRVKELLVEYLTRIQENNISKDLVTKSICDKIYAPINLIDLTQSAINQIVDIEFNHFKKIDSISWGDLNDRDSALRTHIRAYNSGYNLNIDDDRLKVKQEFKRLLKSKDSTKYFKLLKQISFLNFNYTQTVNYYQSEYFQYSDHRPDVIHIHGELNDKYNPIIFGYGDEIDEKYKTIENLNANQYLENIKSMKYSETSNYRRMMDFIESDLYQVFILGHSCGISDRTLLNTLFEHENCGSIKQFYYQRDNGDDYNDKVMNISRNFNDKRVMRERVVNKTFCEPLVPFVSKKP